MKKIFSKNENMLRSLIQIFLKSFKSPLTVRTHESQIGTQGEDLAAKYLKKEKAYKLVARNWRYKQDEIDIIAQDGNVLVFVEVKTSTTEKLVPAYYSVTKKKKRNLARACKAYLKTKKPNSKHFRFDIITVKLCQREENHVNHYTNVRLFSKNFHALSNE